MNGWIKNTLTGAIGGAVFGAFLGSIGSAIGSAIGALIALAASIIPRQKHPYSKRATAKIH